MSIEQDWKKIRDWGESDGSTRYDRCMVDLHDRLAAVQKRLAEAQTTDTEQPDPSDWVGDLCMYAIHDSNVGPRVLERIIGSDFIDERGDFWVTCRPATDEERIRYKGEPPTENGELCFVRRCFHADWSRRPYLLVGADPDYCGFWVKRPGSGDLEAAIWWREARKLTPFELKQHQAGEESK